MSFILDALKKSETDRARQSGPALYEVKVPPPRHGLPLWALVVVVLLAVNLAIGMWMLLRRPPRAAADAANAPNATAPPAAAGATAGTAPAPIAAQAPAGPPVPPPTQTSGAQLPSVGAMPAAVEASARAAPAAAQQSTNPEDYEPAVPAAPPAQGTDSHVRRGTADGVPLYQEVATQQGASLPQLRLDLHVYAAQPSQRFVMINMRRLREGDTTAEGARVESITPDGAVISYNGSRFLLTRD